LSNGCAAVGLTSWKCGDHGQQQQLTVPRQGLKDAGVLSLVGMEEGVTNIYHQ
jgi:hypothetical protein